MHKHQLASATLAARQRHVSDNTSSGRKPEGSANVIVQHAKGICRENDIIVLHGATQLQTRSQQHRREGAAGHYRSQVCLYILPPAYGGVRKRTNCHARFGRAFATSLIFCAAEPAWDHGCPPAAKLKQRIKVGCLYMAATRRPHCLPPLFTRTLSPNFVTAALKRLNSPLPHLRRPRSRLVSFFFFSCTLWLSLRDRLQKLLPCKALFLIPDPLAPHL